MKINRSTKKENKSENKSKLEYFGKDSLIAMTPEMGELNYLVWHWNDLGQVSSSGFGIQPLQWSEVECYSRMNHIGEWESLILHAMSRMFVKAKRMFDEVLCECPYRYEDKPMIELQLLASRAVVKQKVEE